MSNTLMKKIKETTVKVGQQVRYIKSQKFSYLGSLPPAAMPTLNKIIISKKITQ